VVAIEFAISFAKENILFLVYGIGLSACIALLDFFIGVYIALGAAVLAILFGMVVSNTLKLPHKYNSGITYSEKTILAFSVATMGIELNFSIFLNLGFGTIVLMILSIAVTIFSAIIISKIFNIEKNLGLLLGIGNGICGSSAIGATKNIFKANDVQVGISVAVINFLGTVGMFGLPLLAIALGFNQIESGILIGNTLQAVGQAVAGGFAVGDISGQNATVVKMGRVLLLTPVIIILMLMFKEQKSNLDQTSNRSKNNILKSIPLFIVFFLLFSSIATMEILPEHIVKIISQISHFSLLVALSAVGLRITFSNIKENGKNALIIGSLVFAVQILFTVCFIFLFLR
jgi:uncharacterized integral membrane protein (TIGR00698 family)